MSELLDCVVVGPSSEQADGAVVWLHGLGADGHDFEPIVPMLGMPKTRFVFPNAPRMPVTINGGFVMPAWYDILSMEPSRTREHEPHIRDAATKIVAILDDLRAAGIPAGKIVLAGFSQGGAVALHVGTRYAESLAGIMVLSAYHLLRETQADEQHAANTAAPMLFCHGSRDPVVPIGRGEQAHADHKEGRETQWHDFPMQHEVCPEEIGVIGAWLKERLGP